MTKYIRTIVLSLSAGSLLSISASAQENGVPTAGDFGRTPQPGQPVWQASAITSYDAAGAAHFDGAKLGDSDVVNYRLQTSTLISLNDAWFLGLGLISDNFALQQVSGAPVPADIHTLRFNVGLGYRVNDKWTFNALVSPALERLEDVRAQDVSMAGGLLARYQVKPSLTLAFGLFGVPDSDIPVMPVVGLRWQMNDMYTLDVGMPKTRLSCLVMPKWSVYGGLDLNGAIFRDGESLGTKIGSPQYNNALATYRDIRVGLGTSYEFLPGLRAELEGGYSVYREIYYIRIDDHVRFDPAPYVRLGVNFRF
jgi:hypothetical protein